MPKVQCVARDTDGKRFAVFGYSNVSGDTLHVPLGVQNAFSPSPSGRGQPLSFTPGTAPHGFFSVPLDSSALDWKLGVSRVTADDASPTCSVLHRPDGLYTSVPRGDSRFELIELRPNLAVELTGTIVAPDVINGEVPGRLQGSFHAENDGSLSYSLPLDVPAGRAGVQPNLSLSYSSRSGDGPVGPGWNVSGLSQISRCRGTEATVGAKPIHFDDQDALCLDGDLLIPVGDPNANGGPPNEYRPEHDPFMKIVLSTDPGDIDGAVRDAAGPRAFTAYAKDGRILHYGTYGKDRQSVIKGLRTGVVTFDPGGTTVDYGVTVRYAWALSEVEDRSANRMTYRYALVKPGGTGAGDGAEGCNVPSVPCAQSGLELLPQEIRYTYGANFPAAPRSVRFTYEPRTPRERFVSGLKLTTAHRLSTVQMWGPNPSAEGFLYQYVLNYAPGADDLAVLAEVRLCAASACLPPLTFGYQRPSGTPGDFTNIDETVVDASDFTTPGSSSGLAYPSAGELHLKTDIGDFLKVRQYDPSGELVVLDVNGDGRDDVLYRTRNANGDVSYVFRLSDGFSLGPPRDSGIEGISFLGNGALQACIVSCKQDTVQVGAAACYQRCYPAMPRPIDIDMDGRPELAVTRPDSNEPQFYRFDDSGVYAFVPDSPRFPTPSVPRYFFVADGDGNGAPDFWAHRINGTGSLSVRLNSGSAKPPRTLGDYSTLYDVNFVNAGTYVADLDGSGRTSLLFEPNTPTPSTYYRAASFLPGGTDLVLGTDPLALPIARPTTGSGRYVFYDANGDGLDDAALIRSGGALSDGYLNVGNGFVPIGTVPVVGSPQTQREFETWSDPSFRRSVQVDDRVRAVAGKDDGTAQLYALNYKAYSPSPLSDPNLFRFAPVQTMDVDGDGATETVFLRLLRNSDGDFATKQLVIGRPKAVRVPVLLTSVQSNGAALSFEHRVFFGDHDGGTCGYPLYCPSGRGMYVLERATATFDGVSRSTTYAYVSPRTDVTGRGFLGFAQRTITDVETGATTQELFDNTLTSKVGSSYPFAHLPNRVETTSHPDADTTLNRVQTMAYEIVGDAAGRKSFLVVPKELHVTQTEIRGGTTLAVRDQRSILRHDAYANVVQSDSVANLEGSHTSETFEYDNLADDRWLLGLLRKSTSRSYGKSGDRVVQVVVAFEYDASGLVSRRVDEPGGTNDLFLSTSYTRNANGLVTDVLAMDRTGDMRVNSTTYDIDEGLFAATTTNGAGHVARYVFHPGLGVLARAVDANGTMTTLQYDPFGRLRHVRAPDGDDSDIHYASSAGYPLEIHQSTASGALRVSYFDHGGRLARQDSKGFGGKIRRSETTFDPVFSSLPAKASRPHFLGEARQDEQITYDNAGRLSVMRHPDGAQIHYRYRGLRNTVIDELGNASHADFDELGSVVKTTDDMPFSGGGIGGLSGGPISTVFAYGPGSELDTVTDAGGNVVRASYDIRGRRVALADPDSGTHDYRLNAFGEVVSEVDGMGRTNTYVYDTIGRLIGAETKDGVTCVAYDTEAHGVGEIASTEAENLDTTGSSYPVRTRYRYDSIGRPIESTVSIDGTDYTTSQSYDGFGRLGTLTYPTAAGESLTIRYEYWDAAAGGAVRRVFQGTGPDAKLLYTVNARDASGALTDATYGNGLLHHRAYDNRGLLRRLSTSDPKITGRPGADLVQSLVYAYNADGTLASRVDEIVSKGPFARIERFEYDALQRLTTWSSAGWSVSYEYDAIGNMTARRSDGRGGPSTETYRHGPSALSPFAGPHAVTFHGQVGPALGPGGRPVRSTSLFAYDGRGDRTRSPESTIEYTAFDLPRSVEGGGGTTRFEYDATAARVAKAGPSGTTIYVGGLYEKRAPIDGATTHVFRVAGPDGLVAEVIWEERGGAIASRKTLYLHADRLGSAQTVTDDAGSTVDRQRFDPFGRRVDPDDPTKPGTPASSDVGLGFTGHQEDAELSLVDMDHRLYDPATARFITPDPMTPSPYSGQSYNRYSYALNNPLSYTDPSGFDETTADGAAPPTLPPLTDIFPPGTINIGGGGGGGGGGPYSPTSSPKQPKSNPRVIVTGPENAGIQRLPGTSGADNSAGTGNGSNGPGNLTWWGFPTNNWGANYVAVIGSQGNPCPECEANAERNNHITASVLLGVGTVVFRPVAIAFAVVTVLSAKNDDDLPLAIIAVAPVIGRLGSAVEVGIAEGETAVVAETGVVGASRAEGAGIRVTDAGIARVEGHLERMGAMEQQANVAMVQRLKDGQTTVQDINFYMHELKESAVMARTGGYESYESLRAAHMETLQWQKIPYAPGYESQIYHPDVIRTFPDWFNPAAWPK